MQIKIIKKDKLHLTKITFADNSEVLIDNEVVYEKTLKVGADLSEEYIKELVSESHYRRAKSRAIWYLDRSAHTEKALFDKLLRGGFPKKESARVIARLKELGLLDDRKYAENYCERLLESNVSKREALQKMFQKGVPLDLAKEILSASETDELQQIKNVIIKKYRSKLQTENGWQKVYAALIRKGFSYENTKKALNEFITNYEEDYV
jgi:regulatory protein